jgi:hypothetical protein
MKSYVDSGNTTQSNQINSINANIGSYYTWANANVAGLSSQIAGANAAMVSANSAVVSYVNTLNSAMASNVAGANAAIITANTALKGYTDNQVTTANTAMKSYVDTVTTAWTANAGTQATQIASLATNANANTAAYLAAGITTNITSTGTITGGNLTSGAEIAGYGALTLGNIANATATKTRIVTAGTTSYIQTGNGTAGSTGSIVFSPTLDSTARVTINTTSGDLTATGNITGANLIAGTSGTGNVYASNIIVNGQPTTYGVANPAYAFVYLNTSTSYTNSAFDMVFDTIGTSNGITYSTSTGLFSLIAGVTYELETNLYVQFEGSINYISNYQWVDSSNNALSPAQGQAIPVTSGYNDSGVASLSLIYTPSQNMSVKVRWVGVYGGRMLIQGIKTWAKVKQLNPTIAVQATATGTVSKNYAKYVRTASQSVSANSVVICNVLENTSGTAVSVNTSTGQVTLTAGTYRLRGTVGSIAGATAASFIGYGWYNETTSAYIGEGAGWFSPQSLNYNTTAGGTAEAVITVASTTVVSFRVVSPTNVSSIGGTSADWGTPYAYPWIDIEQMGATFALNALDTISTTGNVAVGGNLTTTGGIRKSARVLTTTTTLTVADASGFIEFNGGPYTVTLPDPTQAVNSGIGYRFWQNTGSNITLSTPAGAFYGPSGSSTSTKVLAQATTQYWDVWSDGYNWAVFGIKTV